MSRDRRPAAKTAPFGAAVLCALLPFLGCASFEEFGQLSRRVAVTEEQQQLFAARLEETNQELQRAWALLFCGNAMAQLMDDVKRECASDAQDSTEAGASCSAESVAPAVVDADPAHRGLFLSVIKNASYEALPIGSTELTDFRRQQLDSLLKKRMRQSRVLVVARMNPKEKNRRQAALKRARVVVDGLHALGVIEKDITTWSYSFPMTPAEKTQYQGQIHSAEPHDVDSGVWVILVNC